MPNNVLNNSRHKNTLPTHVLSWQLWPIHLKKLEIYIQMAAEDAPCGEVHKPFGEQPMGTELVSRTCSIQVVIATQLLSS